MELSTLIFDFQTRLLYVLSKRSPMHCTLLVRHHDFFYSGLSVWPRKQCWVQGTGLRMAVGLEEMPSPKNTVLNGGIVVGGVSKGATPKAVVDRGRKIQYTSLEHTTASGSERWGDRGHRTRTRCRQQADGLCPGAPQ